LRISREIVGVASLDQRKNFSKIVTCDRIGRRTLAPAAWNKDNPQKSGDMSKPVLALLLAGILSGCVTSGGPYSQSASRAAQPQQARTQVQDKVDKSQVRSGSQIVLGATY